MSALSLLLVSLATAGAPAPSTPAPADARAAAERALPFLMKSSAAWRENRKCVTCHQVPFCIWPLNEAKARGFAVDARQVDDLTAWSLNFCTTDKNKGEFTGGFLSTMMKTALALEPAAATDREKKAYEFFIPLVANKQRPDGSWKEGNFIGVKDAEREGIEVDTMWTVLGLNSLERQAAGALSPAARDTIARCRQRAVDWLKTAEPATRTDWLALRMLVEAESGDAGRAWHWRQELQRRQNPDGGWPFTRGGESHPLVTGECLYALSCKPDTGDGPPISAAWRYLISTQEPDGSWKALSRQALGAGAAKKVNAVTTHWGTGWAAIGLIRTMPRTTPLGRTSP